ncbi:MAG: hypothetical protein KDD64_07630 [Bdellovibrionales bacterium]|nr:hypothetical protein [Bdellovibrionales bacterium]
MKGVSAVSVGGLCGSMSAVVSLSAGIPPVELLFSSVLILMFFSMCWACFAGIFSAPAPESEMDQIYRFTRFATGLSLACLSVAVLSASTLKISLFFSLSLVGAFLASTALLLLYFCSAAFLLTVATNRRAGGFLGH